jgi:hypothetical protein
MHYSSQGNSHRFGSTNAKLLVYSCTTMDMVNVGADAENKTWRSTNLHRALVSSTLSSVHSPVLFTSEMFSKLVVLVAAAAVASVTAQTATTTVSAATAPTEVTDCHAHGENELFCFDADNEEWELTSSGFTADNLPEAFEDCHMHDKELWVQIPAVKEFDVITNQYRHCVDGNTEVTLVSASTEDDHAHDHDHEDDAAVHVDTTMTSVTPSVSTDSANGTASSTSTASRTRTTSSAPTAVTNCHTHDETELFCLDDSDEWQVTSDWDESNPPENFENCHAHGEEL